MARAAHPRSRGEHWDINSRIWGRPGSSPLARGTLGGIVSVGNRARLIPARAGNTPWSDSSHSRMSAHPRSRGEHHHQRSLTLADVGSSPLARGTLSSSCYRMKILRLIPARAGNTHPGPKRSYLKSAHPRSRGEHALSSQKEDYPGGSSPPVLGTRHPILSQPSRARLIPARAGNTKQVPAAASGARAHPRSRGDHVIAGENFGITTGSSPLARGAPVTRLTRNHNRRLIPARAGNTQTLPPSSIRRAAHPRSRGEHD